MATDVEASARRAPRRLSRWDLFALERLQVLERATGRKYGWLQLGLLFCVLPAAAVFPGTQSSAFSFRALDLLLTFGVGALAVGALGTIAGRVRAGLATATYAVVGAVAALPGFFVLQGFCPMTAGTEHALALHVGGVFFSAAGGGLAARALGWVRFGA